jgi:large subunit ribosomal protein L29
MAIGSKNLTMEKLDSLDNERIISEIGKAKEELFNLRFSAATGQLENHGRFKELKRDVARLKTILKERELDIRTAPTTFESEANTLDNKKADTKDIKTDKKEVKKSSAKKNADVKVNPKENKK